MPIQITCWCGQGFLAKDRLAGKVLQCPKCGNRLKIPPKPAVARAAQPAGQSARQAPNDASEVGRMADLLAEAEREAAVPSRTCAGCGATMSAGDVLCIACGLNQKSGRRLQTTRGPEVESEADPTSPESHEDARKEREAMKRVAQGLGLVLWAVLLMAATGMVAFWAVLGGAIAGPVVLALGMIAASAGGLAAAVMSLGGWLLCLAVPSRTGAKELVMVSLALMLATGLVAVTQVPTLVTQLREGASYGGTLLRIGLIGGVFSVAANFAFLHFLKKLAATLRYSDLAARAEKLTQLFIALLLLPFASLTLMVLPKALLALVGPLVLIGVMGMMIYTLVLYAGLLHGLRKEILGR